MVWSFFGRDWWRTGSGTQAEAQPRGSRRRRKRLAARDRAHQLGSSARIGQAISLASESLESRAMLAVASFDGGTGQLSIVFEETGSNAEAVTAEVTGGNIVLSGAVTGATSTSAASVNSIVLSATGNSTAQQMTFQGGTAYSLSSGLSSTGVDTVTITQAISTGTGNISITAPRNISVSANLTTTSGTITLDADRARRRPDLLTASISMEAR